ncbi:hypothetical protein V6N13_123432 [Hibiscus sabdariffa]
MVGVNSGQVTWANVVAETCMGCETEEVHYDQVLGFQSIDESSDPINNDSPLIIREADNRVSILDLGEEDARSGLIPSWAETIDNLNTIQFYSPNPETNLNSNNEEDKSGNSDRSLPEIPKRHSGGYSLELLQGFGNSSIAPLWLLEVVLVLMRVLYCALSSRIVTSWFTGYDSAIVEIVGFFLGTKSPVKFYSGHVSTFHFVFLAMYRGFWVISENISRDLPFRKLAYAWGIWASLSTATTDDEIVNCSDPLVRWSATSIQEHEAEIRQPLTSKSVKENARTDYSLSASNISGNRMRTRMVCSRCRARIKATTNADVFNCPYCSVGYPCISNIFREL